MWKFTEKPPDYPRWHRSPVGKGWRHLAGETLPRALFQWERLHPSLFYSWDCVIRCPSMRNHKRKRFHLLKKVWKKKSLRNHDPPLLLGPSWKATRSLFLLTTELEVSVSGVFAGKSICFLLWMLERHITGHGQLALSPWELRARSQLS